MTKSHPKVSIIIPVFNSGQYLSASLDSINEKISIEIILVDDGSTDPQTLSLLKKYEELGIPVLHQTNSGTGEARNAGAKLARGEYLLFLDADDLIQKDFCTTMSDYLDRNPSISFCYPNEVLFGSRKGFWDVLEYDPILVRYYQYFMVTSLMRKNFFQQMGGFDLKFKYLEDREFWVRAAIKGFMGKKMPLMHFYRHHHSSKTSAVNKSKLMNKYEKMIHQKFKSYYKMSDYLNKRVLFYSMYIKLFYLIPKFVKDWILKRSLSRFLEENRDQVQELFPEEVNSNLKS